MHKRIYVLLAFMGITGLALYAQNFSGRSGGDVFITAPFRFCIGQDDGNATCLKQVAAGVAALMSGSIQMTGLTANSCLQTDANKLIASTGIPCGSGGGGGSGGTLTSTGLSLPLNQLLMGNVYPDVKPIGSFGTSSTVLHGNPSGAPTFGSVLPGDMDVSADNTTSNASTTHHGLLPKLSGNNSDVFHGDGTYSAVGGVISGLTTGVLPKASSATTIANSGCDEGVTTANTFTCSDSAGSSFVALKITGTCNGGTAGCAQFGQGTVPTSLPANTIVDQAPTSVTSYRQVRPGVSATGFVYSTNTIDGNGLPVSTLSFDNTVTKTIANGTSSLGTGAISSGTCATVVTTSATGTATTDNIMADFNGDPTGVTGYVPSSSGMLTIIKYPTTNNVNFKVCNNTSGSITPGAITLNWRVVR